MGLIRKIKENFHQKKLNKIYEEYGRPVYEASLKVILSEENFDKKSLDNLRARRIIHPGENHEDAIEKLGIARYTARNLFCGDGRHLIKTNENILTHDTVFPLNPDYENDAHIIELLEKGEPEKKLTMYVSDNLSTLLRIYDTPNEQQPPYYRPLIARDQFKFTYEMRYIEKNKLFVSKIIKPSSTVPVGFETVHSN